jgi:radical SAM protein with 4Fe4S-binding SPASM domain
MKSNINELVELVKLASEIGIDEVKVVYLTTFTKALEDEVLWNHQEVTKKVFNEATKLSEKLNISLKLPYLVNEDPALDKEHKDCYVAWRDFFIGSDNYIRPCMSTPVKFFKYNKDIPFLDMWNNEKFIEYRKNVNTSNMDTPCKRCYQSSYCNWNKKYSFIKTNENISPSWDN